MSLAHLVSVNVSAILHGDVQKITVLRELHPCNWLPILSRMQRVLLNLGSTKNEVLLHDMDYVDLATLISIVVCHGEFGVFGVNPGSAHRNLHILVRLIWCSAELGNYMSLTESNIEMEQSA